MSESVNLTEYKQAMGMVKRFKNLFMFLLLLSLLIQASSFIMLEFTPALDLPGESQDYDEETSSDSISGELYQPQTKSPSFAEWYREVMSWLLPATKFMALAMGVLLVVGLMYAGVLSLLGRGRGTAQMVGAFFWSLILLAMLIPWEQIYNASPACGVMFNAMELLQAHDLYHADDPTVRDSFIYYGRFLAYPGAAFLVWLVVAMKFAGGYRKLSSVEPKSTSVGT